MSTFVYIATTQEPVRIQKITAEDSGIQSVVCLNHSIDRLPISESYHQFVKKGSGLIHRDFGHDAFRIDVEGAISQGNSWQLGLYIAHSLHSMAMLCMDQPGDPAKPGAGDLIIWATGTLSINHRIGSVDQLDRKLLASKPFFDEWLSRGCKLMSFMPSSESHQLQPSIWQALELTPNELGLHFVDNFQEVKDQLGLALPQLSIAAASSPEESESPPLERQASSHTDAPAKARSFKTRPLLIFSLLLISALAIGGYLLFDRTQLPKGMKPSPDAIDDFGGTPANWKSDSWWKKTVEWIRQIIDSATLDNPGAEPKSSADSEISLTVNSHSCSNGALSTHTLVTYRKSTIYLDDVCSIKVQSKASVNSVMAIALDTAVYIPISSSASGWNLPLPKLAGKRPVAFLVGQTKTPLRHQRLLREELNRFHDSGKGVSLSDLAGMAASLETDYQIFSLELIAEKQ